MRSDIVIVYPDSISEHTLAFNGSKGEVHLYRKERGKEAYFSKGTIHYESIPELALIIENLGNAWGATTP